MFGRYRRITESLSTLERLLDEVDRRSELMQTVLMVREPETVTSANAYEGLRKQIVATAQERWAHLAQLAQMDAATRHAGDVDSLRSLSSSWLEQAGVIVMWEADGAPPEQLFEILGGDGQHLDVQDPAYVDAATGRIVRMGRASWVHKGAISSERGSTGPSDPRTADGTEAVAITGGEGSGLISDDAGAEGGA